MKASSTAGSDSNVGSINAIKPYANFMKVLSDAKREADDERNRCKHYTLISIMYIIIFIFPLCPIIVFIVHSDYITSSHNVGVETSEYFIIFGVWCYLAILSAITEVLKAISISKFVGFDKGTSSLKITKYKTYEYFYYFAGFICPIIISFIPCILRNTTSNKQCYVKNYELFIIIWNSIVLDIFIGFRLLRYCHILSYRISTSFYFAKQAYNFWGEPSIKERECFLNIEQIEKWNNEYLLKQQLPINSITKRRAFFATMFAGISLPIITLILLIILPFNDVIDSPILIQLICIMVLFEMNVLLLISQSALCNNKWQKAIKRYQMLLFDKKFENERKGNNIDFVQITQVYLPIFNYWNAQFFGLKWFGIQLDWKLFFKLFSLMFVNAAVYFFKSNVAHKLTF